MKQEYISPFLLVRICLFITIFFLFSNIVPPIRFLQVPFTLQTVIIMCMPFFFRKKEIILCYASLFLLTAFNIPLMSHFTGGLSVFTGKTAGFIYGWVLQSILIKHWVTKDSSSIKIILVLYITSILDVLCGALWNIAYHNDSFSLIILYAKNFWFFAFIKAIISLMIIKLIFFIDQKSTIKLVQT